MSVEAVAVIRHRPYPNLGDPSLPESVWYTQGGVAGDVSGGHAEIAIILNAEGETRSGRAWSIEVSLPSIAEEPSSRRFRVVSLNMDNIGPGLTGPIQKSFVQQLLVATDSENPNAAAEGNQLHIGIFMGAQMASNLPATLQGQFDNRDGSTYGWYAAGYEWGPQSLNVGYRIPAGGFRG